MTIMSNGDFRKLMNATMRLSASCRKCGRPIQFEGGANLARDSGIHGSVVQCSTCRSVYTVDVGVDRLMLVADVTADYPAGTPPRHPLFNPPPGWLAPPPNWTPPAGWQPDPSWPTAAGLASLGAWPFQPTPRVATPATRLGTPSAVATRPLVATGSSGLAVLGSRRRITP